MPEPLRAGCVNHPGFEAIVRCKRCGTPVCGRCVVMGPTGRYCSVECRENEQALRQKAADLAPEPMPTRRSLRLKKAIKNLIGLIIILTGIAAAGILFPIPVLSDFIAQIRGMLGL
jgi:hypothetical protein